MQKSSTVYFLPNFHPFDSQWIEMISGFLLSKPVSSQKFLQFLYILSFMNDL